MVILGSILALAGIIWGCAIPGCFLISLIGISILAIGAHKEKYE